MAAVSLLLFIAVSTLLLSQWISHHRNKFPPGPRPDPFIGNVRQLPTKDLERSFLEWKKIYGDVIYAKAFSRSLVVLNSLKAARDLLEKRSGNYSCRPRLVLLVELMGWMQSLPNMQYGASFRKHRKWMLEYFSEQAIVSHRYIQRSEASLLLLGLLETPDAFLRHVKKYSAGSITRIAYGHTAQSADDEFVRLVDETNEMIVRAASYGAMIVDLFPILKYVPAWMPGAGFKRHALATRKMVQQMYDSPFQTVRDKMVIGTAVPSFTSQLLLENDEETVASRMHDHLDIKGAAASIYAAGVDTTSATLGTFFLMMVRHPDALARAQAEIDNVVGTDRLPDFDDRPSLPYVDSLVQELYRYHSALPLGVPHRSMDDDKYSGYRIPKDSTMIPNIWAMSRDCEMYRDPYEFIPDRFMHLDKQESAEVDPKNYIFGFGRRQCPGRHFADASVWLAIASMAAAFNIVPASDEAGEQIIPPEEFLTGFVRHVKPFPCKITVRDASRASQVLDETYAQE